MTTFLPTISAQTQNEDYNHLLKNIISRRDSLFKEYSVSGSIKQDSILKISREFVLNSIIDSLFNYWYNTPWNFNGTSRTPKQGSIACGYFITAVLSDVGFTLPRVKWAQLASEEFILKMTKDVKRFYKQPVDSVISYIRNREDGLYIAGLDFHVGFVYKRNGIIQFVHSNYLQREIGVMSQDLDSDNPLNYSRYRVIGRILDEKMLVKWLENQALN